MAELGLVVNALVEQVQGRRRRELQTGPLLVKKQGAYFVEEPRVVLPDFERPRCKYKREVHDEAVLENP